MKKAQSRVFPLARLKYLLLIPAIYLLLHGAIWLLWIGVLLVPTVWPGRWRWRPTALFLTPVALMLGGFSGGVLRYVVGAGAFEGMGLPSVEYWNLDKRTRAPKWNGGCLVAGHEFLTLGPNNIAMELMGVLFGRMPWAYDSPYPDRAEAAALLAGATERVEAKSLLAGRVALAGKERPISPELWRFIHRRQPVEEATGLPAALLDERLLLIGERGDGWSASYLIDLRDQQEIATYFDRTESHPPK
jgi:hypothetical protein